MWHSPWRLLLACVALASVPSLVGCGGARGASDALHVAGGGLALPPVGALDAWLRGEPESPEDRLLMAFALEAAGEYDRAVAVLVDGDDWPDVLQAARAMRVGAFRHTAPAYEQWVGPVANELARSSTLDPVARVLWTDHASLAGYREHRYGMRADHFDFGAFGVPVAWRTVGPLATYQNLALDTLVPGEREGIADGVRLPTGPVEAVLTPNRASGATIPASTEGIYLAETFFEVRGAGRVALFLSASVPYVATVDGVEVARRMPEDAFGAQGRWAVVDAAEGGHRLVMKLAWSGGGPITALAVGLDGAEVGAMGPETRSWHPDSVRVLERDRALSGSDDGTALGWLVAADAAILSGDGAAALELIDRAWSPTLHPVLAYHLGRLAPYAYELGPTDRSELALAASQLAADGWEGALAARVAIGSHHTEEGHLDQAWSVVETLRAQHPDDFAVQSLAARLFEERGWDTLRRDALERAAAAFPRHCPTIGDLLEDRSDHGVPITPESLPLDWLACDQTQRALALEYHLPRGEIAQALDIVRLLHSRNPSSRSYATTAADLALAAARPELADAVLGEYARWSRPDGTSGAWRADRAASEGDPDTAVAELEAVLARFPTTFSDAMAVAYLRSEPMLAETRQDGVALVREYLDSGATYEGPVVYVWDYGLTRWFEDGSAVEHVHQILQLRTRDALAEYGEVGVPAGAVLLGARTIKQSGRAYVPDPIAGKDSISMPNLELGDFIELEWAAPAWGPVVERAAVRSDRFYFQGFDGPFHHSVAEYVAPEEWGEPTIDLRGHAAALRSEVRDGLRRVRVEASGTIPPVPDPRAVHPAEWLPSVQVAWQYDWDVALGAYANALRPLLAPTDALAAAVAELTAGARGEREQVRALFRYVSDEVPDLGGFMTTPASWTLQSREGERLPLLLAMLDVAGFDADLVFVRPWDQDLAPGAIPDPAVFDLTAVRVATRDGDIWLEPDFERYPFDYLRIDGQGCDGLVVWGPNAGAGLTTPSWPTDFERNDIRATIALREDGSALVEIDERIPVRVAHSFRRYVQSAEDELDVRRQLESGLASTFPAMGGVELRFDGLELDDGPITIHYRFESAGFAQPADGALVFDGEIFSRPLSSWYGGRADREQAILVGMPVIEALSVTLQAPTGWEVRSAPDPASGGAPGASWSRRWTAQGGRAELDRRIDLQIQRVEPEDYPAFAASLAALRAGDRMRVVFEPAP